MKELLFCMLAVGALAGCRTAGIKRAYMSLDSAGERKREVFFTDSEAIFCVAEIASGRDDLSVLGALRSTALYSPLDGTATPDQRLIGVGEEAPGKGDDLTVSFELDLTSDDQPFPAGAFVCDISLDGELEESLAFEIRFPSCPVAPLISSMICDGFVVRGSKCPGAISGTTCTCSDSGAWECG